jgi:hypothetical protein
MDALTQQNSAQIPSEILGEVLLSVCTICRQLFDDRLKILRQF